MRKRTKQVILNVLAGIAALLVLLLLGGYAYQRRTTAADFRQYPAPGRQIEVEGSDLHIFCQGEGGPTVVVDAGNGDFSLSWRRVQTQVAESVRICTYDRAGYAWSSTSPHPRTARQVAQELHALLIKAGETGPYILVGHSLGGLHVRMFADMYPDDVAGMVLVDAAHKDQWDRLPPEYAQFTAQQTTQMRVMELLARFGALRILAGLGGEDALPEQIQAIPADLRDTYLTMISQPDYFRTAIDEFDVIDETVEQVRQIGDLGDLPLVVLTAAENVDAQTLERMGLTPEDIQPLWTELQQELAALSTNSTQLIAQDSGHHVHLDRPDSVVAAIAQVIAKINETSPQ
jgi:pimeloyl-ACP methyl ester carboxylesterase